MAKELIKDNFLGMAIKSKRKAMGLNQTQVAGAVGLSRVQIVNIERGKNGTTYQGLYSLCCLFNCSPNELFPKVKPMKTKTIMVEKIVLVRQKVKVRKTQILTPQTTNK